MMRYLNLFISFSLSIFISISLVHANIATKNNSHDIVLTEQLFTKTHIVSNVQQSKIETINIARKRVSGRRLKLRYRR
jgi:glycine betaine/choline ABC-type transport system substrate-binding protein